MGLSGMVYERAVSILSIQETGATVMKRGDLHEGDFFFFCRCLSSTAEPKGLCSNEMTLFIRSPTLQDVKENAIQRAFRKADSATLH